MFLHLKSSPFVQIIFFCPPVSPPFCKLPVHACRASICPAISLYNRFTPEDRAAPMFYPPTLLHTRFPVRAPLPQPCTAPASVYIPPPPPPTLSLSDLHHHHAPSTPPTDCWGCPCSPRWHWRPPWPPWRPPRRAPWRASRGTSCRAP